MANITFRETNNPTIPASTIVKNARLTNVEVDGNFKSLDLDVQTRATVTQLNTASSNTASQALSDAISMAIALG
jgi:hypothetical protein